MSRRMTASKHVRNRARVAAGTLATLSFESLVIASDLRIVKVSADQVVSAVGEDVILQADEHAFLIGVDQVAAELDPGTIIQTGTFRFIICEAAASQRHFNWWGVECTQRVYFAKLWEVVT